MAAHRIQALTSEDLTRQTEPQRVQKRTHWFTRQTAYWQGKKQMGPIEERIVKKIEQAFQPERLSVINESHLHAGHAGGSADGSGETHFRVRVVSPAFAGMSRIERHRALNELLSAEIADGVHALALEPAAPGENVRW